MHLLSRFLKHKLIILTLSFTVCISHNSAKAQTTTVGSASYTNTFPGTDEAGRNKIPSGTPQLSGNALGKPVPTNDWWSWLIKDNHASNLFNYPMALKTTNNGLVVSYIPWGVYDDQEPIVVGVTGLNASQATISDYSDWTVTMDFQNSTHQMQATSGIGMPFIYFNKASEDEASITVNLGTVEVMDEMIIVTDARNGGDFVIYAPSGSTWTQNGKTYTSDLNGKNYWSLAMLPQDATDIQGLATAYKAYAYVFPTNTKAEWNYNESNGTVRTDFTIEVDVKEGANTEMLIGLLPHQWDNLTGDSAQPDLHNYSSVRGQLKTMASNSFSVENTFKGILPTMPYLANYSEGFSPAEMNQKISELENESLATWTDSYNEGQVMNRLIQTARIADQTGNIEARDKMIATIKERLEDWLTYEAPEVAFLFYYNEDWSTMFGYPAGHGQDENINDHHFHWGYFIHAAAFMEQFEPGWANDWGDMVNLLVRDAASANRNDELFPFLRNFSPYAGHAWANGFASFPQGNDQESTSESMQFNSSLIHWGSITGNDEIRDLGIYLYTTEQTAIEEYWFDMEERNFKDDQQYGLVSRVWGNSYDNGTFWTSDITASYVIEMYPIHGGSLYLAHNKDYVTKIWEELKQNTGILNNGDENPNLWHDVIWKYLSFIDPEEAIKLYNENPDRTLKFGVSDAQTYHWLHAINTLGSVKVDITANHPIAAAFEKDGNITYVAHNYGDTDITVNYSDGYQLDVPARSMATSRDIDATGLLTSDFDQAYNEGSVNLSANVEGQGITKVEFIDGNTLIGEKTEAPYEISAENLALGIHGFYSRVYVGEEFVVSNTVTVQVGEQLPFTGTPSLLPGTIEAGHYDTYEGGSGQGVSYVDVSSGNEGNFRTDEAVDVLQTTAEGATVGWISGGEWLEYTIDVDKPGYYEMDFRYASDNQGSRGPFYLTLDGNRITEDISVPFTNGWETWASKSISDIPISSGSHILRVAFKGGEFNLGKMNFTFSSDLDYSQPIAEAGENAVVVLPDNSITIDGSGSTDPDNGSLSYDWNQVYGPSAVTFSDLNAATPTVSGLVKGVYLIRLTVNNGTYSDEDELYIFVDENGTFEPFVDIVSPENGAQFIEGKEIEIRASASDVDGSITQVEVFLDETSIAVLTDEPYTTTWTGVIGAYALTAVAKDNDGNESTSDAVNIEITEAPSCSGKSPGGDYGYVFSDDAENPTITFVPNQNGVGSQTCILYYRTNSAADFIGQNVTPNTPFQLNAAAGANITFYYTYSFPGQGERTDAGNPMSYTVGTCVAEEVTLKMDNMTFAIDENSAVGTAVGTPQVAYSGFDAQIFSIISGNDNNAFAVNESTGLISVADADLMDFEATPTFSLGLRVIAGELSADATMTINLNDLDDVVTSLERAIADGIQLFPNPVSTSLTIAFSSISAIKVVGITDTQGKTQNIPIQIAPTHITCDFAQQKAGIYVIIIEKAEIRYYLKVLKQ